MITFSTRPSFKKLLKNIESNCREVIWYIIQKFFENNEADGGGEEQQIEMNSASNADANIKEGKKLYL
jgi:hypothetical protein